MNLREAVLKVFSGGLVTTLLEFAAVVGFTQLLGPGPVGSYFVFQALIGIIGIPVDLGISTAAKKQISSNEPLGEVVASTLVLKGVLLLPWMLGLLVTAPYVEEYIGISGITPFVIGGLLTSQAWRVSVHFLEGQLRVGKTALLGVIRKSVWVGGGFALIFLGWDGTAIIASFIVGNVAAIVGALIRLDLVLGWPRMERARGLVSFGLYVFVGSVGGFTYSWMDVALLRLFVPTSLIAAYEIAWRVASISMLLTQAIRKSLFPQISSWHAEGRLDEIESAFQRWLPLPLYVTIPAVAGAVVLGREVLGTLFGAEVTVAYPILIVFMVEKLLRSVHMILSPSLFAMDKPELAYQGSLASIVVNLVLNLALIPEFGLLGAATATTLSSAVSAAINATYVSRFVSIRISWKQIFWSAFSAVLMAGGVSLVRPSLTPGIPRLVIGVTCGMVLYLLLMFLQPDLRTEVRRLLAEIQR